MLNIYNSNKNQNNRTEFRFTENDTFETLQQARQDLIGEIQAIMEYDNHIHSTNDRTAIQTWVHIKNEELEHVGELLGLINYLEPSQKQHVEAGISHFNNNQ